MAIFYALIISIVITVYLLIKGTEKQTGFYMAGLGCVLFILGIIVFFLFESESIWEIIQVTEYTFASRFVHISYILISSGVMLLVFGKKSVDQS